jgi:antitoxin (DNA-binding transcriptional repressor) of toxin-antitoxin stability system
MRHASQAEIDFWVSGFDVRVNCQYIKCPLHRLSTRRRGEPVHITRRGKRVAALIIVPAGRGRSYGNTVTCRVRCADRRPCRSRGGRVYDQGPGGTDPVRAGVQSSHQGTAQPDRVSRLSCGLAQALAGECEPLTVQEVGSLRSQETGRVEQQRQLRAFRR